MGRRSRERILGERAPEQTTRMKQASTRFRLSERASAEQPDEAGAENQIGERTSTAQQGTQQFVTFIAARSFRGRTWCHEEIIRVPQVVRVPLAPAALEGLANLRGKRLPSFHGGGVRLSETAP